MSDEVAWRWWVARGSCDGQTPHNQGLLATPGHDDFIPPSRCSSLDQCSLSRRHFASTIERIGVDDPRMSRIVKHGGVVYISGQTDATAADIEGQTRNVLAKVDDLLEQAGTSKSNLLTSSIWLKDINRDFKQMNAVWNDWVDPDNKPVRATVEAAMARPQLLIEIQVTAATGDRR